MSNGPSASQIQGVDAFARAVYRRAKTAGIEFDEVATAVRKLHSVLKHLRAEADDPDSELNSASKAAVYQRQMFPLVEDCEFTLKQLDTVLEKHGDAATLDDRQRSMVSMIASKLVNEKLSIDMFLDTVQLHNPNRSQPKVVDNKDGSLDAIKDKVDAIAVRLCDRRDQDGFGDNEEEMWQQFKTELEKEGFSKDVLWKNKDVLRAYIRELDSTGNDDGQPPTLRGLLEQEEKKQQRPDLSVNPTSFENREDWSPKEVMRPGRVENEKYAPTMKMERRMPEHQPPMYEKHSSDEDNDRPPRGTNSTAMVSTRDLMAMDGVNSQMGALTLHPNLLQNYSMSPSSTTRYLPPNVAGGPHNSYTDPALSSSPGNLSSSPRYAPVPSYNQAAHASPPSHNSSAARQQSRLAPDQYGKDIALDAQWTRIRRSLVSPEVLERAGVRYEARPDFVAILGSLSRDEIAHYAHLSSVARARRASQTNAERPPPSTFERRYNPELQRDHSASSRSSADRTTYPPGYGSTHMNGHANGHSNLYMPAYSSGQGESFGNANANGNGHAHGQSQDRRSSQDSDSESVLFDESDTDDDDEANDKRTRDHFSEKKRRPYVIVPPPSSSERDGSRDGATSSSTVQPRSILKNRNENHVRFDPEPHEISQDELNKSPPRSSRESDRDRDLGRRRRKSDREREYYEAAPRDRDRERERERERGDREYHSSSSSRRHRDYHRDREYYRERGDPRERRERDKKKWGPTLGAMGIGGAAGSLLTVLTEAATGL